MLSFKGDLYLTFKDKEFSKTTFRVLGQIFREGIREWLRELLEHVPVETGMAKAALKPLGRFLRVAVPINPTREPYYSKLEGSMQSIQTGEQASLFEIKDDKQVSTPTEFQFTFLLEIYHYWYQEYYNGPHLPGERAMEFADTRFYQAVFSRVNSRLPDLGHHLDWTSLIGKS